MIQLRIIIHRAKPTHLTSEQQLTFSDSVNCKNPAKLHPIRSHWDLWLIKVVYLSEMRTTSEYHMTVRSLITFLNQLSTMRLLPGHLGIKSGWDSINPNISIISFIVQLSNMILSLCTSFSYIPPRNYIVYVTRFRTLLINVHVHQKRTSGQMQWR